MLVDSLSAVIPALRSYRGRIDGKATVSGSVAHPKSTPPSQLLPAVSASSRSTRWRWKSGAGAVATSTGICGSIRPTGRWLTIRGAVPGNLFSRTGPARPVDLRVQSSPIDLAVVQGFTSAVSNVTGLLQLDVAVTGVSQDPRFSGFVQLSDAAFRVASTGASYRNGNARISLAPAQITLEAFRVEDDKGDPLELSGSASTHALHLGEFSLELSAIKFEFLQNELGDVDINGVLTVSGTPAEPVISRRPRGRSRTGLAADRLFKFPFQRPYATTAQPDPADPLTPATQAMGRWWDRTTLRLRLQATNDLTMRGDNLRFRGRVGGGAR